MNDLEAMKARAETYGIVRKRRFRLLHLRHEWGQWVPYEWGRTWHWDEPLFGRT